MILSEEEVERLKAWAKTLSAEAGKDVNNLIDTIANKDKQIQDLQAKVRELEKERDNVIDDLITRGVTSILTKEKDWGIRAKRVDPALKYKPTCMALTLWGDNSHTHIPCTCGAVKEPGVVEKNASLLEQEVCSECAGAFLSYIVLNACADHYGVKEVII